MAEPTAAAVEAASVPKPADIERAARFTREPFVLDGEQAAEALAPGTPAPHRVRRRAGRARRRAPSTRRSSGGGTWSFLLGLERLLSDDEPKLADGTLLSAPPGRRPVGHADRAARRDAAPDAGNGTANGRDQRVGQRRASRRPSRHRRSRPTAIDDGDEDVDARRTRTRSRLGRGRGARRATPLDEAPEDPNAAKRFWFEHATGAGKTVAALGFVEASRTGGVLILTHRRNLVDQFHGELRDRGYAKRISPAAARRQGPRQRPGHRRDLPVVRAQRRAASPTRTRS